MLLRLSERSPNDNVCVFVCVCVCVCVCVPVLQYRIGQLYMISKHSHEQSDRGEGVEVVQNEPFEDPTHGQGQFTEKRVYLSRWARTHTSQDLCTHITGRETHNTGRETHITGREIHNFCVCYLMATGSDPSNNWCVFRIKYVVSSSKVDSVSAVVCRWKIFLFNNAGVDVSLQWLDITAARVKKTQWHWISFARVHRLSQARHLRTVTVWSHLYSAAHAVKSFSLFAIGVGMLHKLVDKHITQNHGCSDNSITLEPSVG